MSTCHHIRHYDDDDLDEVGEIGVIVPTPLPARTKFDITSVMIQLLKLK